jgi:hypothetical protein
MIIGDKITPKSSKAVRIWEVEWIFATGALKAREVKKNGTYGRSRVIHRPECYRLVEIEATKDEDKEANVEVTSDEHS